MNEEQEDLNDAVQRIGKHETRTSQIRAWLTFLYYTVNKQHTDIDLQQTWTSPEGEIMWGKRKKLSEILFEDQIEWLSNCTNRTMFSNEIILDIDPKPDETQEQFKQRIIQLLTERDTETTKLVWSTGNRGIHIHLYDCRLGLMTTHEREAVRTKLCERFGAEHKVSDKVPIMMEWSLHRKSGRPKQVI